MTQKQTTLRVELHADLLGSKLVAHLGHSIHRLQDQSCSFGSDKVTKRGNPSLKFTQNQFFSVELKYMHQNDEISLRESNENLKPIH